MISLIQRIKISLSNYCGNKDAMHIPPKDTDVDVVLSDCLKEIELSNSEEFKYKSLNGKLIGKLHALQQKLARYENSDFILVPKMPSEEIKDKINEIISESIFIETSLGGINSAQFEPGTDEAIYNTIIKSIEKDNE